MEHSDDGFALTRQGVRNLDTLVDKSKIRSTPTITPVMERKSVISDDVFQSAMGMDLLYEDDEEIRDLLKQRFPDAILEPDYDCIHGRRLGVRVKCSVKEWLTFVIREGLGTISLQCQTHLIDDAKRMATLLDEITPGWR